MTGGHGQLVPISSHEKTNASVVWFGSPIISGDAAKPRRQKLLRRSRPYLNRPGVSLRSTTSDHLVVLEGLRTTDTHQARRYPVSVVTVMLGYKQNTSNNSTRYLSNKWISRILLRKA
jgi:hypothetical protein